MANLARNLEISGVTVSRYLDLMVDLLLVGRLQPWTFNVGKRLVRSPKVYVRDSGITHALLNIPSYNDLLGHLVIGGSWEGFVIENIMSVIPEDVQPFYYRRSVGAEIDLILEFSPSERWAIEIKRSSAPHLSKGFLDSCNDIKACRRFIVYSGKDSFLLAQAVQAISLQELMKELIKQ
jgi:predicted AAA+ superfamily ATPase